MEAAALVVTKSDGTVVLLAVKEAALQSLAKSSNLLIREDFRGGPVEGKK